MAIESDIMTVEELAEYLKLDPQTIYRKFKEGEIPGVKIGKAIRFKRDIIDAWLYIMSRRWDERQQEEMYAWGEQFAKEHGITEEDVIKAIRARRARR